MTEKAYAKLNLLLNVTGKRADGYHNLSMLNCSIDIFDEVSALPSESLSLQITSDDNYRGLNEIPSDDKNLVVRALKFICSKLYELGDSRFDSASLCGNIRNEQGNDSFPNFDIFLKKNIPLGAGLAGGSTDAAAVMRILSKNFRMAFTQDFLSKIAFELGADIPFCLKGVPAVVKGIGEIIEPIEIKYPLSFVILNPGFSVSTKQIFNSWQKQTLENKNNINELIQALQNGDLEKTGKFLSNDLEPITSSLYPQVKELIASLRRTRPLGVIMSGSGPTVFGLYPNLNSAKNAAEYFQNKIHFVKATQSIYPRYSQ